jgi:environmental stress-induced protein Ves
MQLLTATDYRSMPWKNGGGTTREIAIFPAGSSISEGNFTWRVSIADVRSDGAFSSLPGYDRLIMLLDGPGMTLDSGKLGSIALDKPLVPMGIPGELAVTAKLKDGACRDFNVMSDRRKARARLSIHRIENVPLAVSGDSDAVLVYVVSGAVTAMGVEAEDGETLFRDGRAAQALSLAGKATIALVEIALLR